MAAQNGYSSHVVLCLLIGGMRLSLSHVGPSGLVVRDDCEPMPSGSAEIEITVDDSVKVHKVFLPHGVPGARQPIQFF